MQVSHLIFVVSLFFAPLIACAEKPPVESNESTKPSVSAEASKPTLSLIKRGVEIPSDAECVSLDTIADQPEKFSGVEVLVEGEVKAVCQAKGCWMTMGGEKSTSRARVTFKDYAFFVPKDVKGKKVRLRGEVKVKMLSDAERAHLAEDGRVDVSEIPKAELRLVASGVEIR